MWICNLRTPWKGRETRTVVVLNRSEVAALDFYLNQSTFWELHEEYRRLPLANSAEDMDAWGWSLEQYYHVAILASKVVGNDHRDVEEEFERFRVEYNDTLQEWERVHGSLKGHMERINEEGNA